MCTQILMNSNNTFELQTLAMVNREFARDQMSTGTVHVRVHCLCLRFHLGILHESLSNDCE